MQDRKVTPSDLTRMLEGDGEDERVGGLVFLNACRTAEASPSAGSFFKAVFGLKMSGLIATEQQTIDTFACPFGLDFLEAVLDRGEPVGQAIGASEDAEHARQHTGGRRFDAADARMRMRRAHHRGISLMVEPEIVAEAALAGEKPLVLGAPQRLADETIGGLLGFHDDSFRTF